MQFKETTYNNHLSEITQQKAVTFALLKRKGNYVTNAMPWIKCRDFLNEVITSNWDGKKRSIYGFSWNPKIDKTYKTKTMMAIKFESLDDRLVFQRSLSQYSHHLSTYMGINIYNRIFTPTDTIVILEASPFWLKTTVAMSLWTFLLKCLCYEHNNGPAALFWSRVEQQTSEHKMWDGTVTIKKTNEANYYSRTKAKLPVLLKNLKKILAKPETPHGFSKDAKIDEVHNNSGFVFLCEWGNGQFGTRLGKLL